MTINYDLLLEGMDNLLWGYAVLPAFLIVGLYLSFKSRFVQLRESPKILGAFFTSFTKHEGDGVHPLKGFFTCIGGCMGVSNVVAVCTAAQLGGPGALFWIWITAIMGMILKYSEVYLGVRYRVPDGKGGYRGGPMYFLQQAFKHSNMARFMAKLSCILLCIYGVEIYQFSVITENIAINFEVNKYLVAFLLLVLMVAISRKGVNHVGRFASLFIPLFVIFYLSMGVWIFYQNAAAIPGVISLVLKSAFTGHAAVGGFAGSSMLLAVSQGMRRSCYAGDVAVGYASVIHSEAGALSPEKQASFAIVEIFLDSFIISTTSLLLILITGNWNDQTETSLLVQNALSLYFPGMHIFMPLFLLLLGFTTIISYFCAGIKCAEFICPKIGRRAYYAYACLVCITFVFLQTSQALTAMSITAALLLMINLTAIFRLRHEIGFAIP
jgi:alanine or glycine:cation symporter, AGCS family